MRTPKQKKKVVRIVKTTASADQLRRVLTKRKKADLIDVIVELARADRNIMRQLEMQFGVEAPPSELIAGTRQAIIDATNFDEREVNYNFDYDYQAYSTIQRNFDRLVELGQLQDAMKLSLELMDRGSYQVEMSDEGLMSDDIEECLQIVINTLKKCNLPTDELIAWCTAMLKKDRVGFICDTELQNLRKQLESS